MTVVQVIYNRVYNALLAGEMDEADAKNWAQSTVRTYRESVYGSVEGLISNNIQYALTGEEL